MLRRQTWVTRVWEAAAPRVFEVIELVSIPTMASDANQINKIAGAAPNGQGTTLSSPYINNHVWKKNWKMKGYYKIF